MIAMGMRVGLRAAAVAVVLMKDGFGVATVKGAVLALRARRERMRRPGEMDLWLLESTMLDGDLELVPRGSLAQPVPVAAAVAVAEAVKFGLPMIIAAGAAAVAAAVVVVGVQASAAVMAAVVSLFFSSNQQVLAYWRTG